MDYERIHKPLSPLNSGLSPSKLQTMLLGVEKKRKEEEELECNSSLQSEPMPEFEERRSSAADSCKDVESSSSAEISSSNRSRIRSQEESSMDSESVSSGFEFQKAERASANRLSVSSGLVLPFSKPTPSKWDDAEKWIASPTANKGGSKVGVGQAKKGSCGYENQQGMMKFVMEVVDEAGTKRVKGKQAKKDDVEVKSMICADGFCNVLDSRAKPVPDCAALQGATMFPNTTSTVRAVSMRDMGTEMTPITSQEPSRTGTPAIATSPLQSPTSSQASTPKRISPGSMPTESAACQEDRINKELPENELERNIRKDIMVLGRQLGKTNIAAWASKEQGKAIASTSHEEVFEDEPVKRSGDARAEAWEDAEKTKYIARFKQEEIKILAWENLQKAKAEAEMRKIEAKVERMRSHAQVKLMNQLAATTQKAEELRAAAEAKRDQQTAKITQEAEYVRRTCRTRSCFYWSCCS